jgi:hypothetical protein
MSFLNSNIGGYFSQELEDQKLIDSNNGDLPSFDSDFLNEDDPSIPPTIGQSTDISHPNTQVIHDHIANKSNLAPTSQELMIAGLVFTTIYFVFLKN